MQGIKQIKGLLEYFKNEKCKRIEQQLCQVKPGLRELEPAWTGSKSREDFFPSESFWPWTLLTYTVIIGPLGAPSLMYNPLHSFSGRLLNH